jgi:hypothetical protein
MLPLGALARALKCHWCKKHHDGAQWEWVEEQKTCIPVFWGERKKEVEREYSFIALVDGRGGEYLLPCTKALFLQHVHMDNYVSSGDSKQFTTALQSCYLKWPHRFSLVAGEKAVHLFQPQQHLLLYPI